MTDNVIAQMIQNDDDINHRLHHAGLAKEAEELKLFAIMFTELFQVIEGETHLQDYCKYYARRNALSHRVLNPSRSAMKGLKQHYPQPDDFELTQSTTKPNNYEFNFNSEKNLRMLEEEAKKLKGVAMSYLNTRMPV